MELKNHRRTILTVALETWKAFPSPIFQFGSFIRKVFLPERLLCFGSYLSTLASLSKRCF